MARENLLDECGSRPRQTDDENRSRRRVARTRSFRKELGCKDAFEPRELSRRPLCIVRQNGTLQRIGGSKVREGLLVLAVVFERFPERKVQIDAIPDGQFGSLELFLDVSHFPRRQTKSLQ